MTKKHFIRAAEIVAGYYDRSQALLVAGAYIELFRAYNDRFDTDRFLTACGLKEK